MAKSNITPQPIGSLANGVSQQSPAMRLRDQVEQALNVRSTVIVGAGTRTGTKHLAKYDLGTSAASDFAKCLQIHFDRGPDGSYGILVTNSDLHIVNLETGVKASVAYPSGKSWLPDNPLDDVRFCVAGDYLFLANRKKVIQMGAADSAAAVNEGYIYCRASNYEDVTTISLTTAGTTLTWKTKAPGTTAGNGPLAATNVATAIRTIMSSNAVPSGAIVDSSSATTWTAPALPASNAAAGGYTIVQRGALLRVTRADGQPFAMSVSDQDNAKKIYHIQRSIQRFTDLPAIFWPGAVIKVSSDSEENTLDYWVKYSETDASGQATTGYWVECPAPSTLTSLDPATMPWAIRALGVNSFSFGPVAWNSREIGSGETIPSPSFVGQTVQDLFFTSGRLGFVVFDGVVTSRSNDQPFNFWRESSIQLLDTDPIDIISGGSESISFHSAMVIGSEPVLKSKRSQYILTVPSGEALSPRVADLKPISSYQSPSSAPPLPFGDVAYYASPGADFVSINMFSVAASDDRRGQSKSISEHVPAYIKGPISALVGCDTENMLFVLGGVERRELFVYEFLDTQANGRVQSAWSTWTFAAEDQICGMYVLGRSLYFLIRRGSEISLEVMDIGSDKLVGPLADLIIMDRKVSSSEVTISYDALDGGCYLTLPYKVPTDISSFFCVETATDASGGIAPLSAHQVARTSDSTVKVMADVRSKPFILGRAPRAYIEPSEQVARNQNGDPIFADASIASVGPILSQTSGLLMRIGSKTRRKFAKLRTIGQSLGNPTDNHSPMFNSPTSFGAGTGEYVYILRSEADEKLPKRFYKCAGNANDVLVAFENNGPYAFRITGMIYMLAVKRAFTGM